jgi:hypothetical protein
MLAKSLPLVLRKAINPTSCVRNVQYRRMRETRTSWMCGPHLMDTLNLDTSQRWVYFHLHFGHTIHIPTWYSSLPTPIGEHHHYGKTGHPKKRVVITRYFIQVPEKILAFVVEGNEVFSYTVTHSGGLSTVWLVTYTCPLFIATNLIYLQHEDGPLTYDPSLPSW